MTIDDVWNTPANNPSAETRDALLARTRAEIRRAQRRRVVFVAATGTALLGVSALVVSVLIRRGETAAGAAPMLALLLAQWTAFALFVRDMWLGRRGLDAGATIRASLERRRRDIDTALRRQKTVLVLYAMAIPLVGAAVVQLRHAGLMAPHEALSAAAAFAAVPVIGTTVILLRRFLSLRPRSQRIDALLQQYRSE